MTWYNIKLHYITQYDLPAFSISFVNEWISIVLDTAIFSTIGDRFILSCLDGYLRIEKMLENEYENKERYGFIRIMKNIENRDNSNDKKMK